MTFAHFRRCQTSDDNITCCESYMDTIFNPESSSLMFLNTPSPTIRTYEFIFTRRIKLKFHYFQNVSKLGRHSKKSFRLDIVNIVAQEVNGLFRVVYAMELIYATSGLERHSTNPSHSTSLSTFIRKAELLAVVPSQPFHLSVSIPKGLRVCWSAGPKLISPVFHSRSIRPVRRFVLG